jgi:hypothetical protein
MVFGQTFRRIPHKQISCTVVLALFLFALASFAAPENTFDLLGPKLEINVTRNGKTLGIADVPSLQEGDRLSIRADLPSDQSVHYLLVVAFLRGTTNPPPEDWFTRAETWSKQVLADGVTVTVPKQAQQALLFLAPETGGDFSSVRSAVRSKPGLFVRAAQDLNRASLDRSRADRYLDNIKSSAGLDPKELHDRSVLLARTLGIKLDEQCFDRPVEQQPTCLTQNSDQLVLDDGHTQTMVAALTSAPAADLMGALSATSMAGGGFYSAYVGAVVDLARILGNLHTASYQYIPALALPKGSQLNLRLNNPPSFRNPKSVLVVGLPAIEAAQLPPLHSVNPDQAYCLEKAPLILPVEGAPLVYSTALAHNFALRIQAKSGPIDLPATPDPARGGFVIDAHSLSTTSVDPEVSGTLHAEWGFDSFDGPVFHLRNAHSGSWSVAPKDQNALIVGRVDTLHVRSKSAVCVEDVTIQDEHQKEVKATWKAASPDELEIQIPLGDSVSGPVKVTLKQAGLSAADELVLPTYAEAAELDSFRISAGDKQGVLTGKRLDEVNGFELKGIRFVPAKLSRADKKDELQLAAANPSGPAAALETDEKLVARVDLKDGRVLDLQTTVEKPRPKVTLMSKSVQPGPARSPVHLEDQDELPQDGRLSFFLKSEVPGSFPRDEKIEVSSVDDSFHVTLSIADGNLILQNSETVLAVLDPLKSFGPSAFGPLRFRPVEKDGANGDWQPLATLVRIPTLKEVRCPDSPDKQCRLVGSNLFLIDSVASDAQFTHAISVPIGFPDSTLNVPRPNGTLLYIKLRDDSAKAEPLVLPVLPEE